MKKLSKRFLSMLTALMMLVALLPANAFAADLADAGTDAERIESEVAATSELAEYSNNQTIPAYVGQKVDAAILFSNNPEITDVKYTLSYAQDGKSVSRTDVGFEGTAHGRQYVEDNGDGTYSIVENSSSPMGLYYGVVFTDMVVTEPCTVTLNVTMTVNGVKQTFTDTIIYKEAASTQTSSLTLDAGDTEDVTIVPTFDGESMSDVKVTSGPTSEDSSIATAGKAAVKNDQIGFDITGVAKGNTTVTVKSTGEFQAGPSLFGTYSTITATLTDVINVTVNDKASTEPVNPDPNKPGDNDDDNDKTSYPGMDKEVVGDHNVQPGDTINYTLTSTVPEELKKSITYSVGTASESVLTFHDKMDELLSLNEDSISVTVGGEKIADTYYEVVTSTEDGCTFEVTVDLASLYNNDVIVEADLGVAPIVVSYTATLSENAEPGDYQNTAWVKWDDFTSSEDTEDVYTYGIHVLKYDTSDNAVLAGAEFQLTDAEGTVVATGTTDANGILKFDGLKEGTYDLTETKAPDGYVSIKDPITVTVNKDEAGEDYIVETEIGNTPIPHTGGTGTYLYTIGGVAILCLAGAVFVFSRRKKENE